MINVQQCLRAPPDIAFVLSEQSVVMPQVY